MIDLNWRYNGLIVAPIVALIIAPFQINHVHSSVSYQWKIYEKYDQHGHESPSGGRAFSLFCVGPKHFKTILRLRAK